MRRKNYLPLKRRPYKKARILNFYRGLDSRTDEAVLPLDTAKSVFNFDFSSGALTQGYGVDQSGIPVMGICNMWQYRRYDFDTKTERKIMMFAASNGVVYYQNGSIYTRLTGVSVSAETYAVNYRLYGEDVILICSAGKGMYVWNGVDDAYRVESAPDITSLTIHYERMFATGGEENNTVWFSDDLDPTNWSTELDEGGFIQMLDERGKLNKVISFLNYVYIFRDYGISRLTAFADQSEFSATNLYVASGKINAKTVAECGDTILFLSGTGLYRFDGLSCSRVLPQLSGLFCASPYSCAAYADGKYFLAFRADGVEGSGDGNNALLIYDIKTGGYSLSAGMDIRVLSFMDDILYAVVEPGYAGIVKKCGSCFDVPTKKVYDSGLSDFGTETVKTVKSFFSDASTEFTLRVYTEKDERDFYIVPTDGIGETRINMRGRKIGFRITALTSEARIARLGFKITESG